MLGNGKSSNPGLRGTYLVGHDKILYTNGRGIGVRRDYNGVLLLDTILQTPVSKPEEVVKLELLLSEASVHPAYSLARKWVKISVIFISRE